MTSRAPARRRLLLLLLVGAGLVALVSVWGLGGPDGGRLAGWWRAGTSEPVGPDLEAAGALHEPALGPRLRPREDVVPRATHGPVVVEVLDLAGQPLAGVRVEAYKEMPKVQGQDDWKQVPPQETDGAGRVRYDDLPYDGRAVVRAVHPTAEHASVEARMPNARVEAFGLAFRQAVQQGTLTEGGVQLGVLEFRFNTPAEVEPGALTDGSLKEVEAASIAADAERATAVREALLQGGLASAVVDGPTVTLRMDAGLPLRLEVREGGNGRLRRDARCQLMPRLAWDADAFGSATVLVKRGEAASVRCRVAPPEGWIARQEAIWTTTIHPLAQRLEAVYPLRPELEVVLVVPTEAMPYRAEDWEGTIVVAGVELQDPELRVDSQGRLRVRGGGHVMGDQVQVSGRIGTRFAAQGTGSIGPDPREPVVVDLTLRPLQVEAAGMNDEAQKQEARGATRLVVNVLAEGRIVMGPGSNARWEAVRVDPKAQFLALQALQAEMQALERHEASRAALPLRVVGWNGAPAAGARVRYDGQDVVLDGAGRGRLENVPDGTAKVTLLGAGAPAELSLEVGPAPRAEGVLAAPQGGTLEIAVVDTLGRALPYAHIDVTLPDDLPHMDSVDGTQRIDPYTDAQGRRTYRFVTPGRVTVKAYFGTRHAEETLDVADGTMHPVRLTLPVHTSK